mmetsp:Transcript_10118/g.14843  ORF Transcript_10118/g.14843 Transcript_10118/m.14843 type:complete len:129 (-) Transcript_10118:61-447(-)
MQVHVAEVPNERTTKSIERSDSLSLVLPPLDLDTTLRTVPQTGSIFVLGNGAMRVTPIICDLPSEAQNSNSSFLHSGVLVLGSSEAEKLIVEDDKNSPFFNNAVLKIILLVSVMAGVIFLLVYVLVLM